MGPPDKKEINSLHSKRIRTTDLKDRSKKKN